MYIRGIKVPVAMSFGSESPNDLARTTMTRGIVLVISILLSSNACVSSFVQEGKFLGSFATVKQVKIPELLNQLCNDSQRFDALRRDACYGCFYRASALPQGYAMLIAMSTCANQYLNNTSYGHCQTFLQNATSMPNPRVNPTVIYCTFLECIRQVNKDRLLKECVREAASMFPSFGNTDEQLARLFVNTTACVLAKTRCSYTNPVTGEIQDDDIVNKLHLPSINAIFVNTDRDIGIVQLPFRPGSVDVCAKYRNIQQATWPSVAC